MTKRYAQTFSFGIYRTPRLAAFLGVKKISWQAPILSALFRTQNDSFIVGWGKKQNTEQARHQAQQLNQPYLTLEDGFLRSVGLGVNKSPPLSIVIDDLGIYYDATQPSRVENILNNHYQNLPDLPPFQPLNSALSATAQDPLNDNHLLCRAKACIDQIISNKLSKYNDSPELNLGTKNRYRVLVVDQTAGDLSIQYGQATAKSFNTMLQAALDEHPEAEIIIKIHPDVIAGKKQGHLAGISGTDRIRLISDNSNPIHLLQQVDQVYVVTSQLGFEALMLGKAVTCFGLPFYAGWGLTDDRKTLPRRRKKRTVEQLFAAAYILYAHYVNPETGDRCDIETVIAHLALQRHWFNENRGDLYCIGFGIWKRGYVRDYLRSPWNQIKFVKTAQQIIHDQPTKDARIVVWGTRENTDIRKLATQLNIPVWRMEDGFLRSIGLGSSLTAPASLVLDKKGIYFDPSTPSDLETILQNTEFTDSDKQRAESLKTAIVSAGLSKYNMAGKGSLKHTANPGQKIILVPGQVEDDASIRLGCIDICTNSQLLHAVKESHPDAYIIYKPHPDVLSGGRKGKLGDENNPLCNLIVADITIAACLNVADEVHTMTSLVGFEALLRGKQVTTYGVPFYAGWGLTNDRHPIASRKRSLSLTELIAGSLIYYPRYIGDQNSTFTSPEVIIKQLQAALIQNNHIAVDASWIKHQSRKLVNLVKSLTYGLLER